MTEQNNGNGKVMKWRIGELEKCFESLEKSLLDKIDNHYRQVSNFETTALVKMQEMTDSISETKDNVKDLMPRVGTLERWRIKYTTIMGIVIGAPAVLYFIVNIIKVVKTLAAG